MEERRRLIRVEVDDFLEIQPSSEIAKIKGQSKDFSPMGICFSSQVGWQKGQTLLIDYFLPQLLDSVKLKIAVMWSEFIDSKTGYFCGGEIIDIEKEKEAEFAQHYFQRLKEKYS